MRWLARIAAIVAVVLVALVWIVPAILTKGPMPAALPALESSATVDVDVGSHVTFTPADGNGTGVIIYPGGFVDPRSYAPAARGLAEDGSLVVIVEMPLGLAVLGPNRADSVIEDHPEIDPWVIAGHSLGGTMAARYTADHPDTVDGLVLWASYPENGVDLTDWTGEAATVFGTRDGLTTLDDIEQSRASSSDRHGLCVDRRRESRPVRMVRRSTGRRPGNHSPAGAAAGHRRCHVGRPPRSDCGG